MLTRVGKIARIPYKTREQLNLRLLNGELGSPLLKWLNELPDTIEILAELFGGKPITKQNLSEWRHGGYEDWLRHQHRQENFQQMNEQGEELEGDEGSEDLFENFSRIVLAEMAEDLNELHKITDRTERWKRLREISRDLARLQHSYNHSKKVELSFAKWRHEIGDDHRQVPGEEEKEISETASPVVVARASCQCESRGPDARATAGELSCVAPGPIESQQKNSAPHDPFRRIYHCRCSRGCICKECHPDDGKYPYAQAVKDYEDSMKPDYWALENPRPFMIMNFDCNSHSDCTECVTWEKQAALGQLPLGAVPLPGSAGLSVVLSAIALATAETLAKSHVPPPSLLKSEI